MNTGQALLREIWERPEDDEPRLVYSDWLQENGEEEKASFIRQHVIGKYREEEIYLGPSDSLFHKDKLVAKGDRRLKGKGVYPDGKLWWRRGFCYRADVHSECLQWVPYLCHVHPIEKVWIVDKAPKLGTDGKAYWEPGFRFDSPGQIPFFIGVEGEWEVKFISGFLMTYCCENELDAIVKLKKATAKWGRKVALVNAEEFEKHCPRNF